MHLQKIKASDFDRNKMWRNSPLATITASSYLHGTDVGMVAGPDTVPIFNSSQMFNAFAMVEVGCITRESVSTVIYIPAALGYINHVETFPLVMYLQWKLK